MTVNGKVFAVYWVEKVLSGGMSRIGVPVPQAFRQPQKHVMPTGGKQLPEGLWEQMLSALFISGRSNRKEIWCVENPLLVSCRSGAKFSMPGMMDTVPILG